MNPFNEFNVSESEFKKVREDLWIIEKWNWDYSLSHQAQKKALELVQSHTNLKIIFFCSHPHVFTHGRGLQKPKKGQTLLLEDFNPELAHLLPYPLHQIERGGGLTFHYPDQIIIYPITKLNPKSLSLSQLVDQLFRISSEILTEWGIDHLTHEEELLGLWRKGRKLASMGIAVQKLATFHGMALNYKYDESMFSALKAFSPCGLKPSTYVCVDELIKLDDKNASVFVSEFMKRVQYEWK